MKKVVTLKKAFSMFKLINSSLFAALILCFFLPFIEIKCNDTRLGSITGFSMITGGDMYLEDASMMDYLKDNKEFDMLSKQRKEHPDLFSIVAFSLIILGLILSLVLKSFREQSSIIIALLVLALLFVFRGVMLHQWQKQMGAQPEMFSYIKLTLNFAIGFWLIITGCFAISGLNIFSLLKKRNQMRAISEFHSEDSPDTLEEL